MEIHPLIDPFALRFDGSIAMTGNLDMGDNNIVNCEQIGVTGDTDLIDLSSGALTINGTVASGTNAVTSGSKFSYKTAAITPTYTGIVEVVADSGNPMPANLEAGVMVDIAYDATDTSPANWVTAGIFIVKPTGTLSGVRGDLSVGLHGGVQATISNNGAGNIASLQGLQFGCQNDANFVGGGAAKTAQSLSTTGARVGSTFGFSGRTISNYADVENYGINVNAKIDGTYNSSLAGLNYGGYFQTTNGEDGGSGSITSYGVHIDACATGNAVDNSWGLYEANGRDNALAGNTRIGGTTAPTYACDVAGDIDCSGTYRTGGTAGHASATFTTVDGKTVTVTKGLITNVV